MQGLDSPGKVERVINFDCPHSSIDYIHRPGQTGRFGEKDLGTPLVSRLDQVLAHHVEDVLLHSRPLDEVSSIASGVPPHLPHLW